MGGQKCLVWTDTRPNSKANPTFAILVYAMHPKTELPYGL